MKAMKMNKKRVNLTLSSEAIENLDRVRKKLGWSKSGIVDFLLRVVLPNIEKKIGGEKNGK